MYFKELKEHFWRNSVLYQTIKTKERLYHSWNCSQPYQGNWPPVSACTLRWAKCIKENGPESEEPNANAHMVAKRSRPCTIYSLLTHSPPSCGMGARRAKGGEWSEASESPPSEVFVTWRSKSDRYRGHRSATKMRSARANAGAVAGGSCVMVISTGPNEGKGTI